ncbi:enah/Vasp-like a isoform X6 [Engraulis encrasicolus]|uniref:enah/Vasp-like a isoform X6 n=1 Tax=Engraulis encrasicolus TaxID=184585 RepID=UPI002FD64374
MDRMHYHPAQCHLPQSISDSGLHVRGCSKVSEQSICQARASVMVYDDSSKKWVPIKPGQQGFSRINIYQNTANNTFRVVGVKLQDQQVVINYSIVKGLKYNQATPTFHQWRDARQVYGLNFASKEEATTFSNAMLFALNVLSTQDAGPAAHRQNGPVTDDTDLQRRQMMEQHQMHAQMERERRAGSAGPPLPPGHPAMGQQQQQQQQHPSAVPMPVPAPVAPPPAPMVPMAPVAPPPPPGPPPPSVGPPPTPPPPPLPAGGGLGGPNQGGAPAGLAAALAGAKLRKVQRPEEGSGASGGKSDGSRSSGGSGSSGEGLMQEMNALLARRRKASEKPDEDSQKEETNGSPSPITRDPSKKPWDRANSSDKTATLSRVKAGTSSDADSEYDRMKQEILEEVVRELHKVKDEIIDAIRREVMRLSST